MRSLWILCLTAGCASPVADVHGVPETPYDAPDSCWIGDVYVDVCRYVSEEEFERGELRRNLADVSSLLATQRESVRTPQGNEEDLPQRPIDSRPRATIDLPLE